MGVLFRDIRYTKTEKRKIPFSVTKRSQNSYPICFCDPRPPNCGWFHLLFLTHDHFIKPKAEKRKIPFLVTKRGRKSYPICLFDPRPPYCGWFHFLFLTYDHFIEPKPEKRKIPFLVTKRGQNSNLIEFSDPRPQHCGYFHLLLLSQNDRNIPLVGGAMGRYFSYVECPPSARNLQYSAHFSWYCMHNS